MLGVGVVIFFDFFDFLFFDIHIFSLTGIGWVCHGAFVWYELKGLVVHNTIRCRDWTLSG